MTLEEDLAEEVRSAGTKLMYLKIFFNRLLQPPSTRKNVHSLLPTAHPRTVRYVLLAQLLGNFCSTLCRCSRSYRHIYPIHLSISFVGLLNAMAIYPADRNQYLHEAKSSAGYSPATFVLTYTIVEIGFEIISSLAYAAIVRTVYSTLGMA